MTSANVRTITLCGSMRVLPKFLIWKHKLEAEGFKVFIPTLVNYRQQFRSTERALRLKRRENRKHFQKIKRSDAILVLNYSVKESRNYIGGSTFGEIAVAFAMKKKIFLANPITRDCFFKEELLAWGAKKWREPSNSSKGKENEKAL